jgi:hypothetical protein
VHTIHTINKFIVHDLVVKEWKASDEGIVAIKTWRHQVLGVMTEQLHGSKHGQTSVLEFLSLTLRQDFVVQVWFSLLLQQKREPSK